MTQQSFSSFDSSLLVRDAQGRYLPASADQIIDAARLVIDQKNPRGTLFTSLALVRAMFGVSCNILTVNSPSTQAITVSP